MTPLFFEQPVETGFFDSNIGVIKCYNLVFSMNNKMNNIGFFLFSILFFIFFIFIICFCKNGIKPVRDFLDKQMAKKGYIIKVNKNIFISRTNGKSKSKGNKQNAKKNQISNPNKKIKFGKKYKKGMLNRKNNSNHIIMAGININKDKDKKNKTTSTAQKMIKKKKFKRKIISNDANEDKDDNNGNNFGIIKINLNIKFHVIIEHLHLGKIKACNLKIFYKLG